MIAPSCVLTSTLPVRFALDFVRVNDERALGLTAAQFASAAVAAAGLALLRRRSSPDRELISP